MNFAHVLMQKKMAEKLTGFSLKQASIWQRDLDIYFFKLVHRAYMYIHTKLTQCYGSFTEKVR